MIRLALLLGLMSGPALACGADTDCVVGDRTYRIHGAENAANGALVFAHGYRGKAAGAMRNGGLTGLADDLGVALIALQGVDGTWQLPNRPRNKSFTGEAEFSYIEDVLDHAEQFDLNRDRVVMSGFSAGGFVTWNFACHRSELFAGFVPMSGTFWDPVPQTCDSPVTSIVHLHGTNDGTVPMTGRVIDDSKQGDVYEAFAMYRSYGGFGAADAEQIGDLACELSGNGTEILNICLFEGGHSFRLKDLRLGWDMLAEAGRI